jgi:hypothetical protein
VEPAGTVPLPRQPGSLLRRENVHVLVGIRQHLAEGEVEARILESSAIAPSGILRDRTPVRHPDDALPLRREPGVNRNVQVREVPERAPSRKPAGSISGRRPKRFATRKSTLRATDLHRVRPFSGILASTDAERVQWGGRRRRTESRTAA